MADTAYLPRTVIEQLLRAMEALLVASVHGEVKVGEATGTDVAHRPAGWSFADACWFDRAEVTRLVSKAAGGAEVGLVLTEDEPVQLVANLTAAGPVPDLTDLHRVVVAAADKRTDVIAPTTTACSRPPAASSPKVRAARSPGRADPSPTSGKKQAPHDDRHALGP